MKFPLVLFTITVVWCQMLTTAQAAPTLTVELDSTMLKRTSFVIEPIALEQPLSAAETNQVFASKLAYKMEESQSLHQAMVTAEALNETLIGSAFPLGYIPSSTTAHTEVLNDSDIYIVVHTQLRENYIERDELDEIAKQRYLAVVNKSLSNQEIITAQLGNSYTF